jgi:hypothetical protein
VRDHLKAAVGDLRIVSVSQKPLDFGDNICVGEIGISVYNLFKQVLVGAREVKTKFMICAEDDYLYNLDRFKFIFPRDDTFYYDTNRWGMNRDGRYFWRPRTILGMCMAPAQAMVDTLESRFTIVPSADSHLIKYFSEPGKYEEIYGVPIVRMERVHLDSPTITFNHKESLGKARMVRPTDTVVYNLSPWGDGGKLWKEYKN